MKHVQIAHQMPGRVRFKIPMAQDNPELLEQIRQGFADMPGLKQIRVKPDAGSIVLIYDPNETASFEAQLMRHWAGMKYVQIAHQMPGRVRFKIPAAQEIIEWCSHDHQATAKRITAPQFRTIFIRVR